AEREVDDAAQRREHLGDGHPRFLARGDDAQLGARMPGKDAQQLDAGVAGAADDADRELLRQLCLRHKIAVYRALPRKQTKRGRRCRQPPFGRAEADRQRLENCLRRRALWRPTFLRSTSRASRVTSPAFDSVGLSSASYSMSARVMPWRT